MKSATQIVFKTARSRTHARRGTTFENWRHPGGGSRSARGARLHTGDEKKQTNERNPKKKKRKDTCRRESSPPRAAGYRFHGNDRQTRAGDYPGITRRHWGTLFTFAFRQLAHGRACAPPLFRRPRNNTTAERRETQHAPRRYRHELFRSDSNISTDTSTVRNPTTWSQSVPPLYALPLPSSGTRHRSKHAYRLCCVRVRDRSTTNDDSTNCLAGDHSGGLIFTELLLDR